MAVTEARAREIAEEEFTRLRPAAGTFGGFRFLGRSTVGMCVWQADGRAVVWLNPVTLTADFMSEPKVRDTIRHEIAHVFAGRGNLAHDKEWREWARHCGATPRARSKTKPWSEVNIRDYKWVYRCSECGAGYKLSNRLSPQQRAMSHHHKPCSPQSRLAWVETAKLAA